MSWLHRIFGRPQAPPDPPQLCNRVEELARAKFPDDEPGNPSRDQVVYRANIASWVRNVSAKVRYDAESPASAEAADVLERHFLHPRESR